MNILTWILAAGAVLGACALVILIERGIDAMFEHGDENDCY
jgi:hypothetical protein